MDPQKIANDLLEKGEISTHNLFNWLHQRLMSEADEHDLPLIVIATQLDGLHHDYANHIQIKEGK